LTRTFYEASEVEDEDRRRHCGRGDSAEDDAIDVRSGPFCVAHVRPVSLLQH
jgi:hypothetical protein